MPPNFFSLSSCRALQALFFCGTMPYKSKNGRYYVLKGSNAVMIAYNWDQANECFRKYICSPKRQISHCSYLDAQHDALNHLREIAPGLPIPLELPLGRIITVRSLMQQYLGNTEV